MNLEVALSKKPMGKMPKVREIETTIIRKKKIIISRAVLFSISKSFAYICNSKQKKITYNNTLICKEIQLFLI